MKLEESIRIHIDGVARPITLEEIRQQAGSPPSSGSRTIAILDPDSIAPVQDLDPFSGRAPGDEVAQVETVEIKHGIRPVRWLQAAAVFLAVGLSATAVLWVRDGRSVGLDTAGTAETQAAAALATMEEAANATVDGWTQVEDPNGIFVAPDITELIEVNRLDRFNLPWGLSPSIFQVVDIKHLSSGYYAVGSHNDEVISSAVIWRSDDAETWEQVLGSEQSYDAWEIGNSYPSGTGLAGIAEHGGTTVAVGWIRSERSTPAAWVQTSDQQWQVVPLPSPEGLDSWIFSIVADDQGFLVSGQTQDTQQEWDFAGTRLWRSSDGLAWELIEASGFNPDDQVFDIVKLDQTLVAVGRAGGWKGYAAVWISADGGNTWIPSLLPEGPTDLPLSGIYSVAVGPEGLMAIGERRSTDGELMETSDSDLLELYGSVDLAVWTSSDGREWIEHQGPTDSRGHEFPHSVEWGPAGFLITSTSFWPDGHQGSSWLTLDGTELNRVGDQGDVNTFTLTHVATPDSYVGLGDPESHWFTGFEDDYPNPDEKEPQFLEIWQLQVTKADS